MFSFAAPRAPRRASLTPMIDVVFLLLIFFMLTAQFTRQTVLPLQAGSAASSAADYEGAPRLVRIGADALWLNGQPLALSDLPAALAPLMPAPDSLIVLRPAPDADLQRLTDVMRALDHAGLSRLALVE